MRGRRFLRTKWRRFATTSWRTWEKLLCWTRLRTLHAYWRRTLWVSVLRTVYSDTTQLNSTSSCRRVHSVNNCQLSMNVVTQLTQFVGHDVINENTTDLAVRCSTGSVELSWVVSLWTPVYSDTTHLNSTSSWVELRRRSVYSDATQLDVELSWVVSL